MLQQTRIDQGTPYYERFLARFPTVQDLADAPQDDVMKLWEGLGYYSRARNLHKAAGLVARERQGVFPATAEEWLALPGVGRYTAGAIASIAYGERTPVLDGNVKRVLARLYDIDDPVDAGDTERLLWQLAGDLVPLKAPGDFNQALMELGSEVCTPKGPDCAGCPLRRPCKARAAGVQKQRPVKRPKKAVPHRELVAAVIHRRARFLLAKRPEGGMLGGLWEFPGGEVASGETHQEALCRVVDEALGLNIAVGGMIATVNHAYSHFKVTLTAYRCESAKGTPEARTHGALKWVSRARLDDYAFPTVNRKFLELV